MLLNPHFLILLVCGALLIALWAIGMAGWARRRMHIVQHTAEKARTEAIIARETAEAASCAKSVFLAMVSHEIRTPMNGVIGVLDILRDTPLSAEQQHYLGTAMQSARLLLRVINDILDYAKIESGVLPLCNVPYDFYRAMENIAELYLPLARRKNIKLIVVIMPHFDKQLIGDEIRISQVVGNLLSNAITFTEQGEIVFAARRYVVQGQDFIEISVRDTGAGMSEEYQKRLFSPFQQEDTSTTRRHSGTGLGLSIVKHLIDRMGGNIAIFSQRGRGTHARIRIPARWNQHDTLTWPTYPEKTVALSINGGPILPMLRAWCHKAGMTYVASDKPADICLQMNHHAELWAITPTTRYGPFYFLPAFLQALRAQGTLQKNPQTPWATQQDLQTSWTPQPPSLLPDASLVRLSPTIAPPPANKKYEILLVEDNEINRDITLRQLALLGVEAHAVDDGETGYTVWLQQRPRVLFVDCHMPNLDGYGLARRIRTQEMIHGWPRTLLIGFSANATQSDACACQAAGMDDYVPKPTTRASLLAALQRTGFPMPVAQSASLLSLENYS